MHTSYYEYYKQQANQRGAGPVFAGPMIQRGYGLGGIFRNLFSFIRPILKPAAKFLGRTVLKSGSHILSDVASGTKFKEALKTRAMEAGANIINTAHQAYSERQQGKGIKRKRLQTKAHSKRRRQPRRKLDKFDYGSDDE